MSSWKKKIMSLFEIKVEWLESGKMVDVSVSEDLTVTKCIELVRNRLVESVLEARELLDDNVKLQLSFVAPPKVVSLPGSLPMRHYLRGQEKLRITHFRASLASRQPQTLSSIFSSSSSSNAVEEQLQTECNALKAENKKLRSLVKRLKRFSDKQDESKEQVDASALRRHLSAKPSSSNVTRKTTSKHRRHRSLSARQPSHRQHVTIVSSFFDDEDNNDDNNNNNDDGKKVAASSSSSSSSKKTQRKRSTSSLMRSMSRLKGGGGGDSTHSSDDRDALTKSESLAASMSGGSDVKQIDFAKARRVTKLSGGVGGSFAQVWVVSVGGMQCALKELEVDADDPSLAGFAQEIRVLEALPPHDNVVRYLHHKVESLSTRSTALSMRLFIELFSGTLEDALRQRKRFKSTGMPPHEATRVALQIAQGIEHLHKHRLLHRDLKVWNIVMIALGREHTLTHS
jgi:Protein kinase domain